ncbi:MAG: peptidyl-arginine deiminase, partial [Prevotella sp.]|nr:peptidyl-arginine deiminase [Prevotella sp.]
MDLKAHLQNNSISSKDFDTLAKLLLNKSVIRVGNKNYRLLEIEFYLYSSSHPDLITYPRID